MTVYEIQYSNLTDTLFHSPPILTSTLPTPPLLYFPRSIKSEWSLKCYSGALERAKGAQAEHRSYRDCTPIKLRKFGGRQRKYVRIRPCDEFGFVLDLESFYEKSNAKHFCFVESLLTWARNLQENCITSEFFFFSRAKSYLDISQTTLTEKSRKQVKTKTSKITQRHRTQTYIYY